jgi:hypothetical protein
VLLAEKIIKIGKDVSYIKSKLVAAEKVQNFFPVSNLDALEKLETAIETNQEFRQAVVSHPSLNEMIFFFSLA